jgi:hypothetical protein
VTAKLGANPSKRTATGRNVDHVWHKLRRFANADGLYNAASDYVITPLEAPPQYSQAIPPGLRISARVVDILIEGARDSIRGPQTATYGLQAKLLHPSQQRLSYFKGEFRLFRPVVPE